MRFMSVFLLLFYLCSITMAQSTQANATSRSNPSPAIPQEVHKEELVVTGTYGPVPMEESDRSVQSIAVGNAPELIHSWSDALRLDSSLDLRQRAPGVQGDISLRGSSFGQTLVLIDGLRMNDVQTGHANLDLPVPFLAIDRVEVLHGSGSTIYGSDAVGGAVNFITAPASASELRVGAAGGNFGSNEQHALAAYTAPRLSESLTMTRDFSTGFVADRDYRNLAFGSQTDVRTGLGRTTLLMGYADRPFGADQFYGNYNSWERTRVWFAAGAQQLGAHTLLDFGYRRRTDVFILLRDDPSVYHNNHITESWQAALRRQNQVARNATVYYGAEAYRDTIDSTNLGYHGRNRGAGYAALDVRALRRFSFTVGAREEGHSGGHHQFSPSASGGFWVTHRIKLRASASHAFRLPTYTDLYYRDPANAGNPNLRPERAWSYEGGAEFNLSTDLVCSVTAFQQREEDGIDYVRSSPSDVWRATNFTRLNFTGLETAIRLRRSQRQQFDLAYTTLRGIEDALGGVQSKYLFDYPVHQGTLGWLGRLPGGVQSRLRFGVTQRYGTDVYPVMELGATKDFGRVRPYVRLTNVLNTGYEEIVGVRMPGRAVMAGMDLVVFGKR